MPRKAAVALFKIDSSEPSASRGAESNSRTSLHFLSTNGPMAASMASKPGPLKLAATCLDLDLIRK
jgi:hypothetical protein